MKKITLMPNPYRDRGYQITRSVEQLLRQSGAEVKICLPFHVDRSHELPKDLHFVSMEEALRECQGLVCFGGDGTAGGQPEHSAFGGQHRLHGLYGGAGMQ